MSSDNGIYIIETDTPEGEKEYRVSYMAAIDNLWWDEEKRCPTHDEDVIIKNAREMFGSCKVFKDESEAVLYAWGELKNCHFLEYGISLICIHRVF